MDIAMILIFSIARDPSTLHVIRWIEHLSRAKAVRINADVSHRVEITYADDDYHLRVDDDAFRLADVSSAWLRKGSFWFKDLFPSVAPSEHSALPDHLNQKLQRENLVLRDHFHHVLRERCAVLGSANGSTPNKMIALDLARRVGLRTPPFQVSTSRAHAEVLVALGSRYVTKAMSDGVEVLDLEKSKAVYSSYTEALEPEFLAGRGEHLPPSFIQRYIDKRIELRIFFLDDAFDAVAIFSQNDAQTAVDYRHYNDKNPNRVIPFRLPQEIRDKLALLAAALGLDIGSIDMIVDEQGEYYFLEVNPVGQFGGHSRSSNLGIERRIAQRLLAHE